MIEEFLLALRYISKIPFLYRFASAERSKRNLEIFPKKYIYTEKGDINMGIKKFIELVEGTSKNTFFS